MDIYNFYEHKWYTSNRNISSLATALAKQQKQKTPKNFQLVEEGFIETLLSR